MKKNICPLDIYDLSSKVTRETGYLTHKLILNINDFEILQIGSKHIIDGKYFEVVMLPFWQMLPPRQFECFVIFKKL